MTNIVNKYLWACRKLKLRDCLHYTLQMNLYALGHKQIHSFSNLWSFYQVENNLSLSVDTFFQKVLSLISFQSDLLIITPCEWFAYCVISFIFLLKSSLMVGLWNPQPFYVKIFADVTDCYFGGVFLTVFTIFLTSNARVFLNWSVLCLIISTPVVTFFFRTF